MRRKISTSLVALALASALAATSGSASPATFPGAAGKIALASGAPGSPPGLTLINPDGSGLRSIDTPVAIGPVWSADGRWLAYSTAPEPWVIRVVRSDGTGDREVLSGSAGAPATNPAFAWSPSGTEIAYPCATGLCAVRAADGTTRRVVDLPSPSRATNPTWSPDGSRIAFGCRFIAPLCMVRPDGSDPITFTSGQVISFPDWSPDGMRILFGSGSKVYAFDVDDGEVRLLVDMGGELNARARWAPDGKSVVIGSYPDIYVMRLDGSPPTKIAEGALGDWGTSPAATVVNAEAAPRWALGRQVGSLELAGTASHASELQITLRSAKTAYSPIPVSTPAGDYQLTVKLPASLLPGAYNVTVGGASGGERLLDVVRSVRFAAPTVGIVSRAWISASATGRARARVPRDTSTLFARFEFGALPARGQRPVATWTAPAGKTALRQPVLSARVVTSRLATNTALTPGRWRCRLVAGSTVLAVATVRVG